MIANTLAAGQVEDAGGGKHPPIWMIECHTCGFEPKDQNTPPHCRCPKCHGFAWNRLPRPHSLAIANSEKPALAGVAIPPIHRVHVLSKTG